MQALGHSAAAAVRRTLGPSLFTLVGLQAGPKELYTPMGRCCPHPVSLKWWGM
jgi:hypothetical protein